MKKTRKRDELVQAALNTAQQLGLKGLSFRTLAAEVGVKSSSVHYYFPEKADLAYSLIERYREDFLEALAKIDQDPQKTSKDKLDDFIELFMQTACDEKMCLCGMMAAEVDQLDDKSRALLNRYFDDCGQWLTQLFASPETELSLPLAPDTLAIALISALEGALLLDRVKGSTAHLQAQRQIAHSWLH